jgi:hypothetical protein
MEMSESFLTCMVVKLESTRRERYLHTWNKRWLKCYTSKCEKCLIQWEKNQVTQPTQEMIQIIRNCLLRDSDGADSGNKTA